MKKVISELKGHVILAGFGPTGQAVAEKLQAAGETLVVVDRDPDVADAASQLGYYTVKGAVSSDAVLEEANTVEAKALVVTIPDPDRMLACTLMARVLNPAMLIYTVTDSGNRWLSHAGASEVVFGDELVANEIFTRVQAAVSR